MCAPFGKIWVHLLRFDVSLMVTCEGSKGLMRARPGRMRVAPKQGGGEPADPTTAR